MADQSYYLADLSWPEVGRALARNPRLLLPVGALEQHGPHLPLGTNTLIAERLTADISDELGILRAPTLPYGVIVQQSRRYAGTSTLRRKTLHRAVNELLAGWEDHGVTEFILVTAHRYEPHLDALLMALTSTATTTVIDLYQIDVSDLLEGPSKMEHGGELETSLMLHLSPERVRQRQMADVLPGDGATYRRYMRGGMPTPPTSSQGAVGKVTAASAEKGKLLYQRLRAALIAALRGR